MGVSVGFGIGSVEFAVPSFHSPPGPKSSLSVTHLCHPGLQNSQPVSQTFTGPEKWAGGREGEGAEPPGLVPTDVSTPSGRE